MLWSKWWGVAGFKAGSIKCFTLNFCGHSLHKRDIEHWRRGNDKSGQIEPGRFGWERKHRRDWDWACLDKQKFNDNKPMISEIYDSKLTWLLKDTLRFKTCTLLIATLSQDLVDLRETKRNLLHAMKSRRIRNTLFHTISYSSINDIFAFLEGMKKKQKQHWKGKRNNIFIITI